ncbi:MAG: P-loop NTPase [Candidatus Hermodarchaeota archaeon]
MERHKNMKRKIIAVISGKGGVGKTSLTASLSTLGSSDSDINPIVLDCDVDAPNLALILTPMDKQQVYSEDVFTTLKANLIVEKCTYCKECIDNHFCEFNALRWSDDNQLPEIDYLACEGCGACKVLCPEHAFEIKNVKSGEIISYETIFRFPLVYGKTRLGSTTSGKLVADVKQFAQNLRGFHESNIILIDGPPGIGCPVISAISGVDYVVAITEPTPSGLHDLMRAIELIEQFNIDFGIVINKADIESPFQEKFKNYISETGYHILGKINFDLSIPEAMSYAEPVVNYAPNSSASISIAEIYDNLKTQLWNHQ